jgi:hypothetical protein
MNERKHKSRLLRRHVYRQGQMFLGCHMPTLCPVSLETRYTGRIVSRRVGIADSSAVRDPNRAPTRPRMNGRVVLMSSCGYHDMQCVLSPWLVDDLDTCWFTSTMALVRFNRSHMTETALCCY